MDDGAGWGSDGEEKGEKWEQDDARARERNDESMEVSFTSCNENHKWRATRGEIAVVCLLVIREERTCLNTATFW